MTFVSQIYVGMYFGNFRDYSVKIGNYKKNFGCLLENAGCIQSAVVIMTTADGKHPAFSGRHPGLFINSDLYRVVTEIAEVHADIARSILMCIIPLLYLKRVKVRATISRHKKKMLIA